VGDVALAALVLLPEKLSDVLADILEDPAELAEFVHHHAYVAPRRG